MVLFVHCYVKEDSSFYFLLKYSFKDVKIDHVNYIAYTKKHAPPLTALIPFKEYVWAKYMDNAPAMKPREINAISKSLVILLNLSFLRFKMAEP